MLSRFFARILRRHALFHLFLPLLIGVLVELAYSRLTDRISWSALPGHLLSGHRIALYAGILLAYLAVIGIMIHRETAVGLRRLDVQVLAAALKDARSLFAVGTVPFEEWFDPAMQVYLATILQRRLQEPSFRYERVFLLGARSARRNLDSPYLDGYHARSLVGVHERLGIGFYFLEWQQIRDVLDSLSVAQKHDIGYYPALLRRAPDRIKRFSVWLFRRKRVRKLSVVLIEVVNGPPKVFRFSKHDKIVTVQFVESSNAASYLQLVDLIKQRVYEPGTTDVKPAHDFLRYF